MSATTHDKLDLDALGEDLERQGHELLDKAVRVAKEQPHLAVGVALVLGWVLGNGLPRRAAFAAARMGLRAFVMELVSSGALARAIGKGHSRDDSARERAKRAGDRLREADDDM